MGSSKLYPCSHLSGQVQAIIKLQMAFYCPLEVLRFYCGVHFLIFFFFLPLSSRVEISGGYYEYIDVSSCQDIIHLYHLLWSATILNIVGLFLGIITAAILGGFKDMVRWIPVSLCIKTNKSICLFKIIMKTTVDISVQMIFASLQSGQEEGHERTVRKK